jgi:taurine dioxygenase
VDTRAVSPALGAVIEGVRLDPAMDEATIAAVRSALLEHKVVWFREQSLDAASLTAVATCFGTPTEAHPETGDRSLFVEPTVHRKGRRAAKA